jgi:hypothetical protein
MQTSGISSGEKWSCSLYAVFLFVVISSPITYKFTNKLFYKLCKISNSSGAPTGCGLFLHAVLFLLLVRCSMCMKEGLETGPRKGDPRTHTHNLTGVQEKINERMQKHKEKHHD